VQREQIPLPFQWPVADRDEDFLVTDANRMAFTHFTRWSSWPVMATLLTGPRKSGPLAARAHLRAQDGGRLFDQVESHDEEELFHAWNDAQARRRPLVLVADAPPPGLGPSACPDLASRIAATPQVAIEQPDDECSPRSSSNCCPIAASPFRPKSAIFWCLGSRGAMSPFRTSSMCSIARRWRAASASPCRRLGRRSRKAGLIHRAARRA
jgi:hypothetical protein